METNTTKLYYKDPFLSSCEAQVLDVTEKGIFCDQTVAYPEGGGQEGDRGVLSLAGNEHEKISFTGTHKGVGRCLIISEFHMIQVDSPIYHVIDKSQARAFQKGIRIRIRIDTERRAFLTANHSGLHLLIFAIDHLRPGISRSIVGCHIGIESARVDFSSGERFKESDILFAHNCIADLVEKNVSVHFFSHPKEPEVFFWELDGFCIPCGGTHLSSVGCLGKSVIKRKNIGKGLERLQISFPECALPLHLYHE